MLAGMYIRATISKWNAKGAQKSLIIFGRSETQCVAMVTKLLSSRCGAHLVKYFYCKE